MGVNCNERLTFGSACASDWKLGICIITFDEVLRSASVACAATESCGASWTRDEEMVRFLFFAGVLNCLHCLSRPCVNWEFCIFIAPRCRKCFKWQYICYNKQIGGLDLAIKLIDFAKETWLILPVVICLPKRLSHACLSISIIIAKLRMAH